ncbi:hypothetical protein OQA88_12004 [Cercophora sp. LCS_1]
MSGGFYKYRCKYWLTYNCDKWVWVNGTACAYCVAEGRESMETETTSLPLAQSREICVPRVYDGTLHYTLMELIESATGNSWAVRELQNHQPIVQNVVTSATPRPILPTAGNPGQMGNTEHMAHHMGGHMRPIGY